MLAVVTRHRIVDMVLTVIVTVVIWTWTILFLAALVRECRGG